jgi:hypothetical protein
MSGSLGNLEKIEQSEFHELDKTIDLIRNSQGK